MKRAPFSCLPAIAAAAIAVTAAVSCNRTEVIPRSEFSKIYADMMLADQWFRQNPGSRVMADTSLVYEAVLEKYGYDTDDYMASVRKYMRDPERFSRIMKNAADRLDKVATATAKAIEKRTAEMTRKAETHSGLSKVMQKFSPASVWHGATAIVVDENFEVFVVRKPSDTSFSGPEIIICKDTVVSGDNEPVDSVSAEAPALQDSVAVQKDTAVIKAEAPDGKPAGESRKLETRPSLPASRPSADRLRSINGVKPPARGNGGTEKHKFNVKKNEEDL